MAIDQKRQVKTSQYAKRGFREGNTCVTYQKHLRIATFFNAYDESGFCIELI